MLYFILSIVLLFACLGLIGGALLSMLMYLKKIGVLREKIDKAFYQMRHYEEEIKGHATNIEGIVQSSFSGYDPYRFPSSTIAR